MAAIEALDGREVDGARLGVGELAARSYSEQHHFELDLEWDGRRTERPIVHGRVSAGRPAQHISGWIDAFDGGVARFPDDRVELARIGLEEPLFRAIGDLIRPGGWLGLAYETLGEDTRLLRETRRALDRGVPAAATPLGWLLHIAGCGLHIRNWYISEGWREGPRKLQGFKPSHDESRRAGARETAEELRRFRDSTRLTTEARETNGRTAPGDGRKRSWTRSRCKLR